MSGLLIVLAFLVVLLVMVGLGLFAQMRRTVQEQKNYERSLKMLPLLIHLPPPSEDVQANGRDARDVLEESISRAQIIYNIIASTLEKGYKHKVYGQRHFGFEIVGWQGFVQFYATVPIALADVVKQAIQSAYPSARLEDVTEHNIFNATGKLAATTGGEFTLKEPFAYPIATYQDLKRDGLQGILNALSTLEKEDGVAIQLLLRPADPGWTKTASSLASDKRKGKKDKKGAGKALNYAGQVATALVKVPEYKKDGKEGKDLSNLDQSILDAIDDKTRHPGYEVLIRVVASSNVLQRAESIRSNLVAAFSLFDSPGKNGFKFTPTKDIQQLTTDYILRLFPQSAAQTILNSVELATIFHFPDQSNIPTSQLERQDSKQVDGPRNVPEEGLLLGYNIFRGVKKPIRIELGDRQRHLYTVGQTGTGKSTFLENLALQDMLSGNGFAFVDPHGDVAERLLAMVPKERTEDVIYFCPADMDYPMGLNLFEFHNPDQKDFLIQEAINMLYKLYDPQHQGIMGPRYEDMFRNAALAVMADPRGGTFIEVPLLFRDPQFLKEKLQYVNDPTVLSFWQKQFPSMQRSNEAGEVTAWFVSKFGAFLSNEMMRNIIGQPKSAFNLRDVMDNKKILIVNLSKGRTGDLNSKLLGMIFVMKFQVAAMSRADVPEDQRVDFSLYVDEFQNFSTDSFATIMSEARKYHLNLIVANQFVTQLTEEIRDAVFGNMGTIVAFRVGQNDVEALARYFQPLFDAEDLLRVPNYNTITRTLIKGVPTQPFSMATLAPLGNPNPKLGTALKQLSAAKYAQPRSVINAEITKRLETKPLPASPFAPAAGSPFGDSMPPAAGLPPNGNPAGARPSFLDEWLAKRKQAPAATNRPVPTPAVAQPNHSYLGSAAAPPMASTASTPTGQPFRPQARPAVPAAAPGGQNISSSELEKQEIADIAKSLSRPAIAGPTKLAPAPPAPPKPNEGTLHFNKPAEEQQQPEDTIYIDREGNLTNKGNEP